MFRVLQTVMWLQKVQCPASTLVLKSQSIANLQTDKNPDKAMRILEQRFPKKKIVTVESDDVAKEGGVLNCISWNVKRNS